jgi:hypothetical protein
MKAMMTALIAGAVLICASFFCASLAPAQALPVSNLAELSRGAASPVQNVGYVCDQGRCWWMSTDAYYPPAYVYPRTFYPHAPYGWYGDPPIWSGARAPPPVWYGGWGNRRPWY